MLTVNNRKVRQKNKHFVLVFMQNFRKEWGLKLLKKFYVIYLRLYPSIYELFGNMYVCRIILYFRIQIKQELQEV